MTDAATRIQLRANQDRAFWNANYRPIALQTAAEIAGISTFVPRYQTEVPLASNLVVQQFGVARATEARETQCMPTPCNTQQRFQMDVTQAQGFAMQSVMRAEEARTDARNASRLVKQLETIKVGRGFEANGQSLMAAAGHELSKVAEQQAGVYSNLYNSVGHIVNRSLNASAAPGTVVNKQESQSAPVTLSSVATAIRSLFEG